MCILTWLQIFSFSSFLGIFFQARAYKFDAGGALNTLIDMNPVVCANHKIQIFADHLTRFLGKIITK